MRVCGQKALKCAHYVYQGGDGKGRHTNKKEKRKNKHIERDIYKYIYKDIDIYREHHLGETLM
jgi:hypothetical protein